MAYLLTFDLEKRRWIGQRLSEPPAMPSTALRVIHILIVAGWPLFPVPITLPPVNPLLAQLTEGRDGFVRRDEALAVVAHHVLDRALASGRLVRLLPETYLAPPALLDRVALIRAAVAYAGRSAALSHLTALELWHLPVPEGSKIHLMTGDTRHLRGAPGVLVHRREHFRPEPPQVLVRQGLPVTRLETSIVDSWPLLDRDAKLAPAIVAVAERMTTPARLRRALETAPRLAGRRLFTQLLDKLARGCRSPLELWGYDHIFRGPDLPLFRWQVPIDLGRRTVYLDIFDDETRVNFELDGARYHASPKQRERDLRRDAALAALGITVVRFAHSRLVHEPEQVRCEVRAIIRAHRPTRIGQT